MSNEIQQLFAVQTQRITTCADKESHAVIHEEESGYKVLIHISFYQVFSRKRNITHNEQEICDVFSTFIYNHLTNKKVGRKCAVALCPSLATRENTLVSFPRFLFIQDHTAAQTGDNMLEYPKKLDIQGHKYTIHARINSKTRTGFHYYTIATIPNRGIPFIGTIDNMAGYISIPSIRHNRKNQLQQSPNYPVIVCYHKDDC